MITWHDRLAIRKAYEENWADLSKGKRLCPYSLGVQWDLSPIEDFVWGSIRYLGIPMYPQVPVGRYFVDFADIYRRIAIEVDSIKWHRGRAEKDAKREIEILRSGWEVIRFPSKMVYSMREDFTDDEGYMSDEQRERFFTQSAEGVLYSLYFPDGCDLRRVR